MATPDHGVTGLLQAWGGGEDAALDQLVPIVYDELRHQAQRYLRQENPGHTATVKREWAMARAWLKRELDEA